MTSETSETSETSATSATSVLGRVGEIWVFPVKSMSGATVDSAEVDAGGLVGDRSWAVVDDTGTTVTAKEEPRLREVRAGLVDGEVVLDVPGVEPGLAGDAAAAALSSWLGRPLSLTHRGGTGFLDSAPVHVVSRTSISDATHADECDACDISAPRANLVLDLEPSAIGGERAWVGDTVEVGEVALAVVRLPGHCLGVYADVPQGGSISVGDEVRGH